MAQPSDFKLGENGLSSADESTISGEEGTLEDITQQEEREMGSNGEPLDLTPDSETPVEPNQLFDEEAERTTQPDHDEQLNEMEGSDDEASSMTSDFGLCFGLNQLRVEEAAMTDDGAKIHKLQPVVWNSEYSYQPLSSGDSTRVLVLFPAQNEVDELRCHMDQVRLSDLKDESQGFTALSYVWGADETFYTIWFGSRSLQIRPNLNSALRNLRRRDRPIRLWVDAVCIDQYDVTERNHQVQQMRDIFSAASETIIYLGPQDGGNTGHLAWTFLDRHSSCALDENRDMDRNVRMDDYLNFDFSNFRGDLEDVGAEVRRLANLRGDLKDVEADVLSRSWFRRLWVFQEAVVSRSLSIQCGDRRISWDDFCKVLFLSPRLLDDYGFSLQENQKLDIVRDINISRREYLRQRGLERFLPSWQLPETFGPSKGDMNILAMLSRARYLEASDARDKIYGLVGISTGIDTADPRFSIDYRLGHRELYTKFARNHIEATKSYDILSYIDAATASLVDSQSSQSAPLLPSWVPDWHYQDYVSYGSNRTILETLPAETPMKKKSRQRRVADGYHSLFVQQRARTLVVPGRIIGRIERHTLPLRLLGRAEETFQGVKNSTEDESQRFTSIMELWARNLYFEVPTPWPKEWVMPLKSPTGDEILATKIDELTRTFSEHFQEARMKTPASVEHHLYARARQTANWREGANKASYVITDKESIVDGKRLAMCKMETGGARNLALVPSMAHEWDYVIQISGSRVPFVVKATPNAAWPGEEVKDYGIPRALLNQFTCQIVGECLLNDFKELAQDKMDTKFVIL